MVTRYCHRCKVPRILVAEHTWGPNGTIVLSRDPTHRMVIIDNVALTNILDSISSRIGIPLDEIIVEAKRKSGRHFMDALLSGVKGVIARNLISARVYQQMSKQVSMLGLGHAEVVSYKRHRFLEGIAADVYSAPALAGDICGAFESVERCRAVARFEHRENGHVRIQISRTDRQRSEYEDRFVYRPQPALPGDNIFELCPVCKAPLELGRQYAFDMDRGLIHEVKTGHRAVLTGVMTLNNLFGELEKELGEEIPHSIMTIEKERVKEVITGKEKALDFSEAGYQRFMKTLRLRGMGNGRNVTMTGGHVEVRVDNPYYEPLVAGFLAGFYEVATGEPAVVEWTPANQGYTDVSLSPAQ
ncbi:MAG: hypothetical protein KJ907_07235 [Actinobacteria bacterium]|nr:hypothetical protein [Actinomycetota bacterium]MCG2818514.1 hypothetical protein [Actinomycetes bacterium]MBU4358722.1 hypothetical protein [Actinomycetota bacterium]MBU4391890.1 hypothetical protein [Actinomycetota bacterium]MBU4402511.1 hypothetical protein [Actinomycetota bacterium]